MTTKTVGQESRFGDSVKWALGHIIQMMSPVQACPQPIDKSLYIDLAMVPGQFLGLLRRESRVALDHNEASHIFLDLDGRVRKIVQLQLSLPMQNDPLVPGGF